MATFAVGDIHGNLSALRDVLDQIRGEVRRRDTVVFLGDYIDRGPDSKGCIDAILKFRDESVATVVGLLGNHEDWLLRTFRDRSVHRWLTVMDSWETIRSYSAEAERIIREAKDKAGLAVYLGECSLPYEAFFDAMPLSHLLFLETLQHSRATRDCFCSHGGVDPDVPNLKEQSHRALIWGGEGFPEAYDGKPLVVYGHRNNATLDAKGWPSPTVRGRTIGIDTISHGVLTAIRLPDRQVFQSARYEMLGV